MKKVTSGMESEDDVVWEESHIGGHRTVLWYIPFASFYRHTAWWNSIGNEVFFVFDRRNYYGRVDKSGYEVRLVLRKSGSDPTKTPTTQEESEFSDYAPEFDSYHESEDALYVSLVEYDCS
ncbi:hypothetical protein Hanom_Chr02g00107471 [Helianthus anomalus]